MCGEMIGPDFFYLWSNLVAHSALFGAILPFIDKTQIQKGWRLKSCLRAVSEGVQRLVRLIQNMNEK